MKIQSLATVCILFACLVSCVTTSEKQVIKQNGANIYYTLPRNWVVQKIEAPSDHYHIISPTTSTKPSDALVTIDFFNQFDFRFPSTETGCADSYLDAIQGHKDPKVRMSAVGYIRSPIYGQITEYRYCSDYFGDHLVSFVITKDGYATIELWVKTSDAREQYTQAFQEVLRSLHITR